MSGELKNFSRSVHDRLLNLARETERPFSELFQLYAMERFLFRLASSRHASNFVLKGGLMLRVRDVPISRPTKDVDLLGRTSNTIENLVTIVREVCAVSVVVDGTRFDSSSAVGSMIEEDADYSGIRVRFSGYLGVAKAPMQLDVGFGDATVLPPWMPRFRRCSISPRQTSRLPARDAHCRKASRDDHSQRRTAG